MGYQIFPNCSRRAHDLPQEQTEPDLKYLDKLPSGRWRLLIRSNSIGRIAETHDTLEEAQAAREIHLGNVDGQLKKSSTLRQAWARYEKSPRVL